MDVETSLPETPRWPCGVWPASGGPWIRFLLKKPSLATIMPNMTYYTRNPPPPSVGYDVNNRRFLLAPVNKQFSCSEVISTEYRSTFEANHRHLVTSPYEWNILEKRVKLNKHKETLFSYMFSYIVCNLNLIPRMKVVVENRKLFNFIISNSTHEVVNELLEHCHSGFIHELCSILQTIACVIGNIYMSVYGIQPKNILQTSVKRYWRYCPVLIFKPDFKSITWSKMKRNYSFRALHVIRKSKHTYKLIQ